jgi:nucleotide-binding universal stress UspA family protein
MNATDRPALLCYDGSDPSKHAIAAAPSLLAARDAIVVAVWQPITALPSFAWGAPAMSPADFANVDEQLRARTQELAEEGAGIAREAGLTVEALAIQANGPIWEAIIEVAGERDVAAIVLGSRGLTGLKSVLLGSVSEGVVRRSGRPTLVVPPAPDDGS